MAKNIRAVIFDYGNVLCPMPPHSAFENLARIAGIPSAPFIKTLWQHRLDYDRGTLDSMAYWKRVGGENGKTFSDLQITNLMKADFDLWVHPSPIMLGWARNLHSAGIKTSILSNMPSDFSTYLRSHAAWLNDFDIKVFSGEIGVVKPDAKIYLTCLDGLTVRPEEALFIDDIEVNVEAARALGINSTKFESIAQLAQEAGQFVLPVQLGSRADSLFPAN
jgi:putative hydrolase of the HAD superfamily